MSSQLERKITDLVGQAPYLDTENIRQQLVGGNIVKRVLYGKARVESALSNLTLQGDIQKVSFPMPDGKTSNPSYLAATQA